MKQRIVVLVVIAVVLLGGFGVWWNRPSGIHLVLITLDTTRADHLGCYGDADARTPVLDQLANAGIVCDRAYTVAPLTLPAHTTLLTGLHPAESGVRRNGRERLTDEIPTLAERLQQQGYDTAAFVSSFVLDHQFGLDRGFRLYNDGVKAGGSAELRRRSGGTVVDAALEWMSRRRSAPTFCWLHFYDPHAPCGAHRDLFGAAFEGRPYDAEIAYVDSQIGRVVEFLRHRHLDEKTLIVIVGDHGEGLGEHLEDSHSLTLYNSVLRVPLIFHCPERLPVARRVASNISLVDLFPTILGILDVVPASKTAGQNLQPLFKGEPLSETACYGATDDPLDVYGCAPLRSLIHRNWKYIRSSRPELYDLSVDPKELNNLVEVNPDQTRDMEARLEEWESQVVERKETSIRLSASERRLLSGLGYVSGPTETQELTAHGDLPDIKDILPLEKEMERAVQEFNTGAPADAIKRLQQIVERAPTHAPACWSLAWAQWRQGHHDQAIAVFRTLLAARPKCPTAHYGLGFMLLQLDQLESAIPEFLKAIDTDPEHVDAHFHLAEALLATGQVNDAKAHLKQALENDAGHTPSIQLLTFIFSNQHRLAAAVADFRQALKRATDAPASGTPLFRP